ncbi:Asp23/Gls24 family envelope stress response protein [Corynebacterium cystitidis]|uniref:Asp23/Gls24 family envelope stress response protein n=1 Tax=Corynebacterium cystitidis TaxID=35757 RepID=UPI00211EB01E|nr:Asp23/Gls24 family envelope stress response protein [Corynebacterium cystitidis]
MTDSGKNDSGNNASTKIAERVFEKIAVVATESVPGAITRQSKLAGLAGSKLPKYVATLDRPSKTVSFEAELAVQFPAPARAIVDRVRTTVSQHVLSLTGFEVARINVTVSAFAVCPLGDRITGQDLAGHCATIAPSPVRFSTTAPRQPRVKPPVKLRPVTTRTPQTIRFSGFLDAVPEIHPRSPSVPELRPLRTISVEPLGGLV